MPRLRVLSGSEVLAILGEFGLRKVHQRGSHIKLRRIVNDGRRQSLTVPNHDQIERGTLAGIYTQAVRLIGEANLLPKFFGG